MMIVVAPSVRMYSWCWMPWKNALIKNKQNHHASTLKTDADSFMGSIVCSAKNQECCEGNCLTCAENGNLNEILSILFEIEEITYS